MLAITALIDRLIKREGGYVNHPADRGGPTKYGITRKTLAAYRKCAVTADDVKALTKAEAAEIYRVEYYFGPKIDGLPESVQEQVFDIAVNSGPVRGVRLMQKALIALGSDIVEDGKIGPKTIKAAQSFPCLYINNVLVYLRIDFYNNLCKEEASQKVFLRGWLARARKFRVKVIDALA